MEERKDRGILQNIISVAFRPASFFSSMPKTGGFFEPAKFCFTMVFIGLAINTIGTAIKTGNPKLASIPVILIAGTVTIFLVTFVGAGILYLIWKLMGSRESYETAYRCLAYGCGISPFTSIISFVPLIGVVIAIAWAFLLLIIATEKVHTIKATLAWAVWGLIGTLFILATLAAQMAYKTNTFNLTGETQIQQTQR